ncbi:MAG: stage IV sporulation protein B [Bacillota bacterium]|nr:MAG: stage IV sporulation protein B [Bacillota bacterium]MBS3951310.1 SpoIVB peptidase [Peptococcaceae bacterium]
MNKQTRKILLGWFCSALVLAICLSPQFRSFTSLPSQLRISEGSQHALPLQLPFGLWVSLDQPGILKVNGDDLIGAKKYQLGIPLSLEPLQQGKVELKLSLFGLTLKKLSLEIVPSIQLVPGGQSVGVSLQSKGSMVVGFATVRNSSGSTSPGRDAGLQLGDRIMSIEGHENPSINTIGQVVDERGSTGHSITMLICRGSTELTITLTPRYCEETEKYRLGLYVRDDAVGIGTLTFVDRESLMYGALGHVITDADTGQIVEVGSGKIVRATVTSIEAGKKGMPGEKRSVFIEEHITVGSITRNTPFGIFGDILIDLTNGSNPLPIALKDQVQEGPAQIYTVIEGENVENFDIEIQRVSRQQYTPSGKGLVIKVTDPKLLEATGGIVQGMSGSPIVQNGIIVGAITHVFVNDPTRGYGIFIEWMIHESGMLEKRQETAPTFFYRRFVPLTSS